MVDIAKLRDATGPEDPADAEARQAEVRAAALGVVEAVL
jgi:hypothetical protein